MKISQEASASAKWAKSDIPYTNTRLILGFYGAIPCLLEKPYLPSRCIRKSSFVYCMALHAAILLSAAFLYNSVFYFMKEAYPYNHYRYILAFELALIPTPMILIPFSWRDVKKATSLLEAWNEFMKRYESVRGKPIPNYKKIEKIVNVTMVLSVPVITKLAGFIVPPEYNDWKAMPAMVIANTVQLIASHHWIGYNLTLIAIADDLSKHLKECVKSKTVTTETIVDYKHMWLLLRNIADKLAVIEIHVVLVLLQCMWAILMFFEALLAYFQTGDIAITVYSGSLTIFFVVPLSVICCTSQTASEKLDHMFEGAFSELQLSTLSQEAQKLLFRIYLIRRLRKSQMSLSGYQTLNQRFLVRAISSVFMYIIILVQFHQMRMSA